MTRHNIPRWPLILIAAPAMVAVWSGWVGLGALCGFGPVHLLPGIAPSFRLNTAITLPVGVEAYGAYALGVWLTPGGVPDRARVFARWSAIGSLLLGISGQIAYHVLTSHHVIVAPVVVTVFVSCMPVITLGCGTALTHLLRTHSGNAATSAPAGDPAPPARVPGTAAGAAPAAGPAPAELPAAAQETAAAAEGRPGSGGYDATAAGAADQQPARGAPAARPVRAPRQRPATEEDLASQEKALGIVAGNRDISGAKLGRQVGVKERQGRYLKEAALATLAEMESGSTAGTGTGTTAGAPAAQ